MLVAGMLSLRKRKNFVVLLFGDSTHGLVPYVVLVSSKKNSAQHDLFI